MVTVISPKILFSMCDACFGILDRFRIGQFAKLGLTINFRNILAASLVGRASVILSMCLKLERLFFSVRSG